MQSPLVLHGQPFGLLFAPGITGGMHVKGCAGVLVFVGVGVFVGVKVRVLVAVAVAVRVAVGDCNAVGTAVDKGVPTTPDCEGLTVAVA